MIVDVAAGHPRLPLRTKKSPVTRPAAIISGDVPVERRVIARGCVGYGLRPTPPHPLPILILIVAALAS